MNLQPLNSLASAASEQMDSHTDPKPATPTQTPAILHKPHVPLLTYDGFSENRNLTIAPAKEDLCQEDFCDKCPRLQRPSLNKTA